MIHSLYIKNFVLVEELSLDFPDGFLIFSGETGAGKSIVIDALSLLLGKRAASIKIRQGTNQAEIAAHFKVKSKKIINDITHWFEYNGFEFNQEELFLRRVLEASGKSRTWINGNICSLNQTKELGELLVEIHSQNAHQKLLSQDHQRKILDEFSGLSNRIIVLQNLWSEWKKNEIILEKAKSEFSFIEEKKQTLTWKINEIEGLNLKPNEWDMISSKHHKLSKITEILEITNKSLSVINGSDDSIIQALEHLNSQLSVHVGSDNELKNIINLIDQSLIELKEASMSLSKFESNADYDSNSIEQTENRVTEILNVCQKIRVKPEELESLMISLKKELENLEEQLDIEKLETEEKEIKDRYFLCASQLSILRKQFRVEFENKVYGWLKELSMENFKFTIDISENKKPGPFGIDEILFKISQHKKGQSFKISQTSSGGELSRIALAITMVISNLSKTPTLIFDEVDAGIGGNTANKVGALLKKLGEEQQILCITHLPQIASKGTHQFLIHKTYDEIDLPSTKINLLKKEERIREIARMLGSKEAKDTSLKHAKSLLETN